MVIVGKDALTRSDSESILQRCQELAIKSKFINPEIGWNGFNILNRYQGEINALEIGLDLTVKSKKPKVIFLLGADNNIRREDIPKDSFVVYIGTHGDEGAQYADVILPAAAFTEQMGTFGILFLTQSTWKGEYSWPRRSQTHLGSPESPGQSSEACLKCVA